MIQQMTISDALAYEMALLDQTTSDPSEKHVVFWQSDQALVAPRSMSRMPRFERARSDMAAQGWPVLTRATGGDVTPQGPGIVNVALVYASKGAPDIAATYDQLCRPMEYALGPEASRGWNPGAFCDGAYNIQWKGKKFAGTAQRVKRCKSGDRYAVLAHALMLIKPPSAEAIDALNTFLGLMDMPRRIDASCHTGLPDGVDTDVFLTNLRDAYTADLA